MAEPRLEILPPKNLERGELEGGWIGIYTKGQEQVVAHVLAEDIGEKAAYVIADLFAAAPDLLAVAQMALSPERDGYDRYDDWHARLRLAAQKAIAKAIRH